MYCKKCNSYLEKGTTICNVCGTETLIEDKVNDEKEFNKKKIIIIVLILIFIMIIGIFIGKSLISKSNKLNFSQEDINNILSSDKNIITFGSYTFNLPKDLQYSNEKNYIYAADKDMTMSLKMNLVFASYDEIKNSAEDFIETVQKLGTQIISSKIMTYEEIEYFVFAIVQNDTRYLYAIRDFDSSYVVQTIIQSSSEKGYEKGLGCVNKIVEDYDVLNAYIETDTDTSLEDFLKVDSSNDSNIGDLFNPKTDEQ